MFVFVTWRDEDVTTNVTTTSSRWLRLCRCECQDDSAHFAMSMSMSGCPDDSTLFSLFYDVVVDVEVEMTRDDSAHFSMTMMPLFDCWYRIFRWLSTFSMMHIFFDDATFQKQLSDNALNMLDFKHFRSTNFLMQAWRLPRQGSKTVSTGQISPRVCSGLILEIWGTFVIVFTSRAFVIIKSLHYLQGYHCLFNL